MPAHGPPERLLGAVLADSYRLDRLVGEGAFGAVFAATHLRLEQPVAVKVLRVGDADAFARFRREAQVSSSLGSPHIARVFDFHAPPAGPAFLVMELLDGEDLGARLARVRALGLAQAVTMARQVGAALTVAHRSQIVHRDLKPSNIFLARAGDGAEVCKVIDFGISKMLGAPMTTGGKLLGSPMYMSPEQVRGRSHEIDARTDVYALGVVLYEALTGRPPYRASTVFELVEQIAGSAPLPPASGLAPSLPSAIDAVLGRALAKRRDDRPATATAFVEELAAAAAPHLDHAALPVHQPTLAPTLRDDADAPAPLWRGRGPAHPDALRFAAPESGFYPDDYRARTLTLSGGRTVFSVGSVPVFEDVVNDCVLAHRQVSRCAARVSVRDGRAWLRREARCNVPVRIGLRALERDEELPLHHGVAVTIGVVEGQFLDGRYRTAQVPGQLVDEVTGLLARDGLLHELAVAARRGARARVLLAAAGPGPAADDVPEEVVAARAAQALHAAAPAHPAARFDRHAAVLLPAAGEPAELPALARAARAADGRPLAVGVLDLEVGTGGDPAAWLRAAEAALAVAGPAADDRPLALRVPGTPARPG